MIPGWWWRLHLSAWKFKRMFKQVYRSKGRGRGKRVKTVRR
jgi:hypothetical protein